MVGCERRDEFFERGLEGFCLGVLYGFGEGGEYGVWGVVSGWYRRWWSVPDGGGGVGVVVCS